MAISLSNDFEVRLLKRNFFLSATLANFTRSYSRTHIYCRNSQSSDYFIWRRTDPLRVTDINFPLIAKAVAGLRDRIRNFELPTHCMSRITTLTIPVSTNDTEHRSGGRSETKNIKGWIFGAADQKTWTQKIYRHTSKFQNPLRQNYKHVKTQEVLLNIPLAAIHLVVVFVGNSTFKTAMPDNVTYARGYIRYIKSKRDVVLRKGQVEAVTAQIEQLWLPVQIGTVKPTRYVNLHAASRSSIMRLTFSWVGFNPCLLRKTLAMSPSIKGALPLGSTNSSINFTDSTSCRVLDRNARAPG